MKNLIFAQPRNALLSDEEINDIKWNCNKCEILIRADLFPMGLENSYELEQIMNSDSLKYLENIPSYEIASKAYGIETLSQYDIDENIIADINSRYYTAHEFKSLHNTKSFNVFHSNFNGLENKFEQLHNFVSSSKLDIDIIGISETSQRENIDFKTNIEIDGYRLPFTLGSKSSRGGVALYAKTDII